MPTFHYKALNKQGEAISGSIEASDRKHVVQQLRKESCKPVRITLSSKSTQAAVEEATANTNVIASDDVKSIRFKSKSPDVLAIAFLKKLLQLHRSGMPIGDVIKNLSQRLTDPELKQLANSIWSHISEGKTLAVALRQNPEVFEPAASYLIEAGEATGNLIPVLGDVIKQIEGRIALRKKIIEGLSYPALLCFMAMGVVALLLFFLMPRIENMMSTMGGEGELPLPARIMNIFSEIMLTQGPFVLIAIVIASISIAQWRKTDKGRLATDHWLLNVPLISGIMLNLDICRMCNMLPTLLNSGINATEALKLTGKSIQNKHIQAKYQAARMMINDGATYLTAFKKYKFLSDMDLDILNVGENTGSPADCLHEIYTQHNEELDAQFKRLTIIVAGGALGFAFLLIMLVVLSIVLSVLGISESIMVR